VAKSVLQRSPYSRKDWPPPGQITSELLRPGGLSVPAGRRDGMHVAMPSFGPFISDALSSKRETLPSARNTLGCANRSRGPGSGDTREASDHEAFSAWKADESRPRLRRVDLLPATLQLVENVTCPRCRHNRPISARFQGVRKDSLYPTFRPAAQAGNRIGPPTLPRPLCQALPPEEKIPNWKRYSFSAATSL
jgi:hypothetical protein